MRIILAAFVIAFAAVLFADPAPAQHTTCGDRQEWVDKLARRFQEVPVAMAMITGGNVLEVLASPEGSWTILVTRPNGVSCMVSAGRDWVTIPRTTEKGDGA